MPEQTLLPESQMMQWITSKWITKPVYIISELGIADILCDGPMSVDTLSKKTGTHAPTLYRLLRALSSVGIFVEREDRVFGLTPLAQCLCSDALGPIARMFLSEWHDKAWNGLTHTIKTGEPGFDYTFGKPSFEWFEENPVEREILDHGQASKAIGFADSVIEAYDLSAFDSICDIGGGRGAFLIKLLDHFSHVQGIVADLPGAVASAEKEIAKAKMGSHCRAIPYDFHKGAPPECDAYFLVNILHDWNDGVSIRILNNIANAMNADSRLLIIEYPIEPGPGFSVAKLLDVEVLIMGGGLERSINEYKTLTGAAGLEVSNTIPMRSGPTMIECLMKQK